ncbi:MAG: hypothetical protein ACRCXT_15340 [Paraclostridium sp.]
MSFLASQFRKAVSKSKDHNMKTEEEFPVGYSTGFLGFDFLNGTVVKTTINEQPAQYYSIGLTDGSMNMIIGRSGCGKTTWAIQTAGEIIKPFKTSCIFHDNIEGGVNDARKEVLTGMNGEEISKRYISRNTGITAENLYERIKLIHDLKIENRSDFIYDTGLYDTKGDRIFKLEPTVYLLDSLALLMPGKFTEEEEISGQMSATAAAKMNAMLFKRVVPMLKSVNIIMLVINHINDNVDIGIVKKQAQIGYLKQDETVPKPKVA